MRRYQSRAISDRGLERNGRLKVIAGLLQQELPMAEIAQRIGLSERWVKRLARVYGLVGAADAGEPPLSRRQARMIAFIHDFTSKYCYPPTIREITGACRIGSTSVTDYNLRILEHEGYLTRKPRSARSIALTGQGRSSLLSVPDSLIRGTQA